MDTPVIQFSAEMIRGFADLSHDRNPLHLDADYCRSTPYGRPVVYGIVAILACLGHWARRREFRLIEAKGRFLHPLFQDTPYHVAVSEAGTSVKMSLHEGDEIKLSFSFQWEPAGGSQREEYHSNAGHADFSPLQVPEYSGFGSEFSESLIDEFRYSASWNHSAQLLDSLSLFAGQSWRLQLQALLGSSYLVGMHLPGRQALYSSFDFRFGEPQSVPEHVSGFSFQNVRVGFDPRFRRMSITGRGSLLESFSIVAFVRPDRVLHSADEIASAIPAAQEFQGRQIFISGASRGFGAVLARAFALQAARVILNYRSSSGDAESVLADGLQLPGSIEACRGDVASPLECQRIGMMVDRQWGKLDFLICNASPPIPARRFLDQSASDFLAFVMASAAATVTLVRELIPRILDGGQIVLISSVYVQCPEPRFTHYIAAKECLEGLMHGLAAEFPKLRFLIARIPRMLTDQTNVIYDLSMPLSTLDVSRSLLACLSRAKADGGNLSVFNVTGSGFSEIPAGRQ